MKTAVAFIIFNRPETTAKVFACIREARPSTLLVIADGPRPDRAAEAERCAGARRIIERVDWDCQVFTNYSDVNLGCRRRVSSGLDWVFETVEEAIVLEDDCVPHPSFFRFCTDVLERYREDSRVMAIGGVNFQFGRSSHTHSYYFSRYNHCWGWASWRRAWKHFDVEMRHWPKFRDEGWLKAVLPEERVRRYWTRIFDAVSAGKIDSWAYPWTLSCWMENGLTVLPSVNLVSNVGFRADATHTRGESAMAGVPLEEMVFPLRSPPFVLRDVEADARTDQLVLPPSVPMRAMRKAIRLLQGKANRRNVR